MNNKGNIKKNRFRKSRRGRPRNEPKLSIYQKYIGRYQQNQCMIDKLRNDVKEYKLRNEQLYFIKEEPKIDFIERETSINISLFNHCKANSYSSSVFNKEYFPQGASKYLKTFNIVENFSHQKFENTDTLRDTNTPYNRIHSGYNFKFVPKIHIQRLSLPITLRKKRVFVPNFKDKEIGIYLERLSQKGFSIFPTNAFKLK
ncbi:hypothetical protein LOD99_13383 [Oopsacas minuta]|uniref:Uncharacterized protein n=1 Tax=Oopsacas minuta TaxID=111878 RepID=A0AAV7KL55_9METZ|nr:hypothetical protein LOD99_13383 [Oopsacas minuta]